jgi:hypothetical protein
LGFSRRRPGYTGLARVAQRVERHGRPAAGTRYGVPEPGERLGRRHSFDLNLGVAALDQIRPDPPRDDERDAGDRPGSRSTLVLSRT